MSQTFTILASDKAFAGCCSRCGGPVGADLLIAEWNGLNFGYCGECRLKANVEQSKAAA
jgi:hypothetical protein